MRGEQLGDDEHRPRRREVDAGDVDDPGHAVRQHDRPQHTRGARRRACTPCGSSPAARRAPRRRSSAMLKKTVPATISATFGASSMPSQSEEQRRERGGGDVAEEPDRRLPERLDRPEAADRARRARSPTREADRVALQRSAALLAWTSVPEVAAVPVVVEAAFHACRRGRTRNVSLDQHVGGEPPQAEQRDDAEHRERRSGRRAGCRRAGGAARAACGRVRAAGPAATGAAVGVVRVGARRSAVTAVTGHGMPTSRPASA